jgi:hypothetical protein
MPPPFGFGEECKLLLFGIEEKLYLKKFKFFLVNKKVNNKLKEK